jgi:hypothetical protein
MEEKYMSLMSEIIAKQSDILGPDIAILKARNVAGLEIGDDGKVTNISGNPQEVLQKLVNEYVELSGLIVKNALGSVFEKYPDIKKIE